MLDWPLFLGRVVRDALRDRAGTYRLSEPYVTRYLSQPGLALSCDAFGGLPYVMLRTDLRPGLMNLESYVGLERGSRVWLRVEDLERFAQTVLPRLHEPFVLVTGDSDHTVPSDFPAASARLVASGLVQRWFSTNYDRSQYVSLITGVPLGLNHARKNEVIGSWRRHGWLRVDMKAPRLQENEWDAIAAAAPPIERRIQRAVADFHMNDSSRHRKHGESRSDIQRQLSGNPLVEWIERRQPLAALLRLYARHAFVISPHGHALDCYRTWEALLMGCIPIVKRSPIDYLYEDLPVAIVGDWREITPENTDRWLAQFASWDRRTVSRALSSEYWLSRIGAGAV